MWCCIHRLCECFIGGLCIISDLTYFILYSIGGGLCFECACVVPAA